MISVFIQPGGRNPEFLEGHLLDGCRWTWPRPGPGTFAVQKGSSCPSPPVDRKPQMAGQFDVLWCFQSSQSGACGHAACFQEGASSAGSLSFVYSSIRSVVVAQTPGRSGLSLNAKKITGFSCTGFVKRAKPE